MTIHSAPGERGDRGGDKRARILDAAERVFAQRGFFAARVSEIAKDAGVADGTIYLYFKSKDDLLISLFESRMRQVNEALRTAVAEAPPSDQLHAFIRTYLKLVHDEPVAAEVLTIELRQSSKFMKEYENPEFVDFLRTLGKLIADGQKRGELDASIPSHVAARMIFGMLDELALAWVLTHNADKSSRRPAAALRGPAEPDLAKFPAGPPGSRPKKFDIVRAADWVVALVTNGLRRTQKELSP